jgi:3-oxoadipate CoA-transferase, beta subunit
MEHVTKDSAHKLVEACTYPLTGIGCVSRIYTDLAVIDVTSTGFVAIDVVPDLEFSDLQRLTGASLVDGRNDKAKPS